MNTAYDNEATQLHTHDDEATQFDNPTTPQPQAASQPQTAPQAEAKRDAKTKRNIWKQAAAGAGSGILVGGLATMLMGMKSADDSAEGAATASSADSHHEGSGLSHPEWVDGEVPVATGVDDSMSFGQAFAAARAEVGPGGCFEWHGGVYGTYTAEEWGHMSAAERAEYGDHFNWNHLDTSSSNVAQQTATQANDTPHTQPQHTETIQAEVAQPDAPGQNTIEGEVIAQQPQPGNDDIQIIEVNHNEQNNTAQANPATPSSAPLTASEMVEVLIDTGGEHQVEIIGAVYDPETQANLGGAVIDGQEVILIDIDGNTTFDYLATDTDGNGSLDEGEMAEIGHLGITTDDMGGVINAPGDLVAGNDDIEPEYLYEG